MLGAVEAGTLDTTPSSSSSFVDTPPTVLPPSSSSLVFSTLRGHTEGPFAMARSAYSPSPSPSLRSNTPLSDSSSDEDLVPYPEASGDYGPSASRPGSPQTAEASMLGEEREADTMTCQWEDCGKVFSHLPTLIEHIHNGELHFSLVPYRTFWGHILRRLC